MLDEKGFDLWADGYDSSVGLSDESDSYPFAGYRDILNEIYCKVMSRPGCSVLEIGFGTGTLAKRLYDQGIEIYGQDFSQQMIDIAKEKMPEAHLYKGDFADGLVQPLKERSYDFITATYSLHHLNDAQKLVFLKELYEHLEKGGMILIGDVGFETRAELEKLREQEGDAFDDEEFYFAAEQFRDDFPSLRFEQKSVCGGIITIERI